ncbi:MAG TPA: DNA polymerase [Candidatus Paceibacterota bacterium]|nr:DNA polymerase [Candidatus Paceibacterota bacterium]
MTKKAKAKEVKRRLVLLDVHAILHRAYHALPDFSSSRGEPTGGLYGLASMLIRIIGDLKPDYIAACYDLPGPTYRHEAYEGYKAQRKKADDALVAQIVRSRDIFTAFGIPIYEAPGFEADDLLGTIAERMRGEDIEVIIASGDMDTLQLAESDRVKIYTLKKGINDTILYDEEAVRARFGFSPEQLPDYKGLRGDPSDNIVGVRGIGEKTGSMLIQAFGTIENLYKALKKSDPKFGDLKCTPRILELLRAAEEEALFSKMLATIRRDAPIEFSLPATRWAEGVDLKKIEDLFMELEFRTLLARAKAAVKGEAPEAAPQQASLGESAENIPPGEVREAGVMLSLLDSSLPEPTLQEILQHARATTFAKAREALLGELKKKDLLKVFEEIEKPLLPVIVRMEERGVMVDTDYLKKLSLEYHKELAKLEKEVTALAGESFNLNSPAQLSRILFEKLNLSIKNHKKTEGGAKSTRESELEKLREAHPIVGKLLAYRELQKLLSTYIDTIPTLVGKDGRLHAHFLPIGAATGRMSSQGPNLQNIPVKTELGRRIRHAFVAPKGFTLVSFDYSQIELRVAAFLSGDEKFLQIFRDDRDIHTEVAAEVFNVPREAVDKEMRRKAKVINFGILYGMGVNALRQNLGGSAEEARRFYKDYFETFTGLADYLERVKASAARKGCTETYFGRKRYFEGLSSSIPYIKASAERMAINAPIQGTQADIIKIAMARIDDYIAKKHPGEAHLLLQVHDEVLYEVKEKTAEKIIPEIKRIMESVLPPEKIGGITLVANAAKGKNWGELH